MALTQRGLLARRSAGRCEVRQVCRGARASNVHHRRARGMGGSTDPATELVTNFLHVCGSGTTGCHGWIESNRTRAYFYGWLVRKSQDPAKVTLLLGRWHSRRRHWGVLTDDGGFTEYRGAA